MSERNVANSSNTDIDDVRGDGSSQTSAQEEGKSRDIYKHHVGRAPYGFRGWLEVLGEWIKVYGPPLAWMAAAFSVALYGYFINENTEAILSKQEVSQKLDIDRDAEIEVIRRTIADLGREHEGIRESLKYVLRDIESLDRDVSQLSIIRRIDDRSRTDSESDSKKNP